MEMKTRYKLLYEMPRAQLYPLPQALPILVSFSLDGMIEDPEYDDTWGTRRRRKGIFGEL